VLNKLEADEIPPWAQRRACLPLTEYKRGGTFWRYLIEHKEGRQGVAGRRGGGCTQIPRK
jgi:hypothetical protein